MNNQKEWHIKSDYDARMKTKRVAGKKLQRFSKLCKYVKTEKEATRLWNWADHQKDPEKYWDVLMRTCPFAFVNKGIVNSVMFTY